MREHLKVINLRDAIDILEEVVRIEERLNEWIIKSTPRLVLKGIQDEKVLIGDENHRPPYHVVVPELRERFVETIEKNGLIFIR